MKLSNLPPGVTDAMIEDQMDEDPVFTDFDKYIRLRWASNSYSAGRTAKEVLRAILDLPEHNLSLDLIDRANLALANAPVPVAAEKGLPGEVGEVMELLKKHERDGKHPGTDLLLELGDVLHYLTVIAHAYGWTLDDVASANITKLAKRDEKKRRAAMSLQELREAGLL